MIVENGNQGQQVEHTENMDSILERRLWNKLLSSIEGRILVMGLGIVILYIFCLALSFLWSPEKFQVLVAMTATHIIFGRAIGMSFGFTMKLGQSLVIPVSMIIETFLVFLFYPLFVFSWRRLLVIKLLKNIMDGIEKAADTHQATIRK